MAKEEMDDFFNIDDDFDGLMDNIDSVKESLPPNKLKKKVIKLETSLDESKELYKEAQLMTQEKNELSADIKEIKTDYEKAKDRYREYMSELCDNMKNIYDKSNKVVNRIDAELDDGPLNNKMVEAFAKVIEAINKLFDNVRATNDDIIKFEERRAIDTGEITPIADMMQNGASVNINNTQIGSLNLTSSEMLDKFKEIQEAAESYDDAEIVEESSDSEEKSE